MLSNWVKFYPLENMSQPGTVGHHLIRYSDGVALNKGDVVIVGSNENYPSIIHALAGYNWTFEGQRIIDLGIVRKKEPAFLYPFFEELISAGVVIIFISSETPAKLWFDLFDKNDSFFSPVLIDEKLDISPASPYGFLHHHLYKCFHLNFIATQVHLNNASQGEHQYLVENLRLGKLRSNKELIEPAMRDGSFVTFNLNAIKKSDAPTKSGVNPSGLNAEEADQICRYAGLSESLTLLNLSGYKEDQAAGGPTDELMAQMLWYFLDGYTQRKQDYPLSENDLTEYVVDLTEPSTSLFFLKSKKSGRWWLKIPVDISGMTVDRLLPCTYHDYQMACEHELSERIIQALERYV